MRENNELFIIKIDNISLYIKMKMNPNIDYKTVEFTGLPTSFFEQNRKNYIQQLKSKLTGLEENSILFLVTLLINNIMSKSKGGQKHA